MRFFIRKKSGAWPLLAIGLVLTILWGNMLLKDRGENGSLGHLQTNAIVHPLELPNFMAPVIRKEIHKKAESEEDQQGIATVSFKLPTLLQIFRVGR